MSNKHYIGLDLTGFEDKGEARPVSRVTLYVDDENVVTAGDDTGLELTGDCPHATQEMADAILARVKGYRYKMYSATSANLDPAAELGDGITAGGIYSVISRISDGGDGYPDLDAPGEAEPEDEFPTEGPITRAFNKKISDTRASITKTAEEILLEVQKTGEKAQENLDAYAETVTKALGELQNQVDGVIQNWFYSYLPTTSNEPASLWNTDEEKNTHLGDVFYVVDNEEYGGQAFRWALVGGAYKWEQITDEATVKALAAAAAAQDTADNKRRVFVAQPKPPYDEGDLWVQGSGGDILRCAKAKESGSYAEGDFVKASKYTDDSTANSAYELASEVKQTAENITLTVSKKVGYDEIISSINQSAEEVSIKANKISLEGAISANGTFTIDTYGYLQCTGGKIGGWTISENKLSCTYYGSGFNSTLNISVPKSINENFIEAYYQASGKSTMPFRVTASGELWATGARISGRIEAESGKIGNWDITEYGLHNSFEETGTPYGDISSDITINAPKASGDNFLMLSFNSGVAGLSHEFHVTAQGELYADSAYIKGELHSTVGNIGGFTLKSGALYNGLSTFTGSANGVYVGTDGISLGGGKFKVDSQGNLTATSGTFTGKVRANQIQVGGDNGYITGSQIGSSTISGGNIGSQTIGVGNMGTNSIENRCIQSGSIYNSTLSGGCVSNAKLDADLQNVIASAITASRITSGLASAKSFSCTNLSFKGYPCYWSRCTSLTDGKYYITRNTY